MRFVGAVAHDDMPSVLAGFDIGAAPYLPSDDFYFSPLKVMEYLAAGLPVVYPVLGDLPELVGDAGVGYEPGSLDALTNALETLVGDTTLRSRCASAALLRAPTLTWDAAAAAVEDVLTTVVAAATEISR